MHFQLGFPNDKAKKIGGKYSLFCLAKFKELRSIGLQN
jgi:hypothetical protein